MLPIEYQISILVHLSKVDKVVAQEEYDWIVQVAKRKGLNNEEVTKIIDNPKPIPPLRTFPLDERFEYLINVIQLMKVDGKIHQKEIAFCEKLAVKLGYKPGVVSNLSAYVYKDPDINTDRDYLKAIADHHLIPMDEYEE